MEVFAAEQNIDDIVLSPSTLFLQLRDLPAQCYGIDISTTQLSKPS